MSQPLNILSLGSGVQSTTAGLMAAEGLITPMPDVAIFADPQNEPDEVYENLGKFTDAVPFPVLSVTHGNLMEDHFSGDRVKIKTPMRLKKPNGEDGGLLGRQCTQDYKILPVNRKIKELCGVKRGGSKVIAIKWLGISIDEAHRAKPSQQKYITHRFPLIEKHMYRNQCIDWMLDHGYWEPPQSSCKNCPFHDNKLWHKIKTTTPDDFQESVDFEKRVQLQAEKDTSIKGIPFLHRSFKPLSEIDFESLIHTDQQDMFGEECEGMCGL